MKAKITKQGIIYTCNVGPFRYQGWPTVTIDENGVLYAAWSGHRVSHIDPFGMDLMSISRDNGETWSAPMIVNNSWLDDRDAGLCYLGNGKMILSWFNHEANAYLTRYNERVLKETNEYSYGIVKGMLDAYPNFTEDMDTWGGHIRISENYGQTWSEPIKVPVKAPHGPVYTKSKRLLFVGDGFDIKDVNERSQLPIKLYESPDEGRSWEYLSTIPWPKEYATNILSEPHLVELPDGRLLVAVRLEINNPYTMFFCYSSDGGKTWTDPKMSNISGAPPHFRTLSDGSIILTYGRREKPMGIRAVISKDGFETWSEEIELTEEITPKSRGDLGYGSTVELPDGQLLTVHYQPIGNGDITSIVYTKWEKPEI